MDNSDDMDDNWMLDKEEHKKGKISKKKKEEKQKFEEINETRKKIELEKKKYEKIKEEKLEVIKSRNYNKTKMIKSNSNPYLKEKINKSKLIDYSMNGKKINKNKKLNKGGFSWK